MADIRGRFLWYELVTPDTEAAAAFYADVVGWGTTRWERGPMEVPGGDRVATCVDPQGVSFALHEAAKS